jgi:hypothetical protein
MVASPAQAAKNIPAKAASPNALDLRIEPPSAQGVWFDRRRAS